MEERISGIEGAIEGIDISIKENAKCKKFLAQNTQDILGYLKCQT
jgi:DNA-binding FrmR family transcriptional regulator